MNRSYSKIRHIQEANFRLERRLISEQAVPQQVTDLFNELKKVPLYQESNALKMEGNRLYYIGNIGGTNKTGMFGKDKSEIGTLTNATDPNARFLSGREQDGKEVNNKISIMMLRPLIRIRHLKIMQNYLYRNNQINKVLPIMWQSPIN